MNDFQNAIRAHLEKRAQEDSQFAEKYRAKMEADKNSIIQCCSYIIQEVKRMRREAMTDSEVYGLAAHFFDEDIKVVGNVNCKVVVSRSDMTQEEIESIKAEARETAKREILEEEVKAEKERIRKEEEKAEGFTVAPIMSIAALRQEGDEMHHCVYRNKYDRKNSLILSVRKRTRQRERIATVEVGLDKFTILQCRGKNNSVPPHHTEICELINRNMNMIRSCANG